MARVMTGGKSAVVIGLFVGSAAGVHAAPFPGALPGTAIGGGLPAAYEPSGCVWHPRLNKLFVVGDEGLVSMMDRDGGNVVTAQLGGDFEGICIADPESDFIYVGIEGAQAVTEVALPGPLGSFRVTRTFSFQSVMGGSGTDGLEALTFVTDASHPEGGVFYAGLQANGWIYVFNVPIRSSTTATNVTHLGTLTPLAGRFDISGLHYNHANRLLYAIFDSANAIRVMRRDGTFITEWTLPGQAQEGVTLDGNTLFIAEDSGQVWRYELDDIGSPCEPPPVPQPVLYVDVNAIEGAGDGTSWADAFVDLQTALCVADVADGTVEEIWVATGTYAPTGCADRRCTFALVNGVAVYGGFAGTETHRDERMPHANVTVLSGDEPSLGRVYHVVTAGTSVNSIDPTTLLDGFTITGGLADGAGAEFVARNHGAGLYNNGGSPTIANCVFEDNRASSRRRDASGGGVYSRGGSPTLVNCLFRENDADRGGGLYLDGGLPRCINCTVVENGATDAGGGLFVGDTGPRLDNCIVWANYDGGSVATTAQIAGAATDVAYSCIQDTDANDATVYPGAGNIDDDPLFADAELHLSIVSPCIDAGDNAAVPAAQQTDLMGSPRLQDHPETPDTGGGTPPIVDMGAFEVLGFPRFLGIPGAAAGDPTSYIFPKADDVRLTQFEIQFDQPVSHVVSTVSTTEGAGSLFVTALAHLGRGIHRVELSAAIPVGHWTRVALTVAGATGIESSFALCLGHLPNDVNADGEVSMADAAAFGEIFRTETANDRIDLNGDGQGNLADATIFGQLWLGTSGHQAWAGRSLPPKLE